MTSRPDPRRDAYELDVILAEEERKRIAEGLHDGPIQWLASASLHVATMLRQGEFDRERLESVDEILGRAIESLRQMMFSLYPPEVDGSDLETAITMLSRWILADAGVDPTVEIDLDGPIEAQSLRSVVSRLVQEAVTNAASHAGATDVSISILERDGVIRVRVSDDGIGFDPDTDAGRPGHLGLRIMRGRAESIGGAFEVSASPGEGTTVVAELPRPGDTPGIGRVVTSIRREDGLGEL